MVWHRIILCNLKIFFSLPEDACSLKTETGKVRKRPLWAMVRPQSLLHFSLYWGFGACKHTCLECFSSHQVQDLNHMVGHLESSYLNHPHGLAWGATSYMWSAVNWNIIMWHTTVHSSENVLPISFPNMRVDELEHNLHILTAFSRYCALNTLNVCKAGVRWHGS